MNDLLVVLLQLPVVEAFARVSRGRGRCDLTGENINGRASEFIRSETVDWLTRFACFLSVSEFILKGGQWFGNRACLQRATGNATGHVAGMAPAVATKAQIVQWYKWGCMSSLIVRTELIQLQKASNACEKKKKLQNEQLRNNVKILSDKRLGLNLYLVCKFNPF